MITGKTIGDLNLLSVPTPDTLIPVELSGVTYHIIYSSITVNSATEVTYLELMDKISGGTLTTGHYYLMTDFQTIYDQPDYDFSGGPKTTVSTLTGSVEPLLVLAISSSEIADNVYSPLFPDDVIHYDHTFDLTEVMNVPAKGRISYRLDNSNNVTGYDHRTVVFKRYETFSGSGIFTIYTDNGEMSNDSIPTFGLGCENMNLSDVHVDFGFDDPIFILPNSVFGEYCESVTTGGDFYNNTIGMASYGLTFGHWCNSNIIGDGCYNNHNGNEFSHNKIGYNFNSNNIGNLFKNNIIDDNFISNRIGNDFGSGGGNTIGSEFYSNTIEDQFFDNKVGEGFFHNYINDYFIHNIVGNNFQENTIDAPVIGVDFTVNYGNITGFSWTSSGTTATDGPYFDLTGTTNGNGINSSFTIGVGGGSVSSVNITSLGGGGRFYDINNTVTILGSQIGGTNGNDDIVITVTGISERPSVYESYNSQIFERKGGDKRLLYYDEFDVMTISDIDE